MKGRAHIPPAPNPIPPPPKPNSNDPTLRATEDNGLYDTIGSAVAFGFIAGMFD